MLKLVPYFQPCKREREREREREKAESLSRIE